MQRGQHLDTVLETLDVQQHSLGVLAVLCIKLSLSNSGFTFETSKPIIVQVQEFIVGCNGEQVRFAPEMCECDNISGLNYIHSFFFCNINKYYIL